jgi:hypothetical protein
MIELKEKTMETPRLSAPEGARPDPEVVATARRRQFSSRDQRRLLEAADRGDQPGDMGAWLRKEGIYSSHLNP